MKYLPVFAIKGLKIVWLVHNQWWRKYLDTYKVVIHVLYNSTAKILCDKEKSCTETGYVSKSEQLAKCYLTITSKSTNAFKLFMYYITNCIFLAF